MAVPWMTLDSGGGLEKQYQKKGDAGTHTHEPQGIGQDVLGGEAGDPE